MSLDNKVVDLADLKVSHDYLLEQDGLLSDRIDELGSGIDGVESIIGDLSNLSTTLKDSIVSAINEVLQTGGKVKSVNGKTGDVVLKTSDLTNDSGYLTGYTETDPTVPSWAKQQQKPSYTASEVGAATTEALTTEINTRTASDAQLQSQITALGNGAPIPVETVAEMIDNTKAYLYTGAEVGWLTGYWYTYDSAQAKFIPRGEYGVGTVIDDTLTVTGDAADAKATGDALTTVNGRLDELEGGGENFTTVTEIIPLYPDGDDPEPTVITNLINPDDPDLERLKYITPQGQIATSTSGKSDVSGYIAVKPGVWYTYHYLENLNTYEVSMRLYDRSKAYIDYWTPSSNNERVRFGTDINGHKYMSFKLLDTSPTRYVKVSLTSAAIGAYAMFVESDKMPFKYIPYDGESSGEDTTDYSVYTVERNALASAVVDLGPKRIRLEMELGTFGSVGNPTSAFSPLPSTRRRTAFYIKTNGASSFSLLDLGLYKFTGIYLYLYDETMSYIGASDAITSPVNIPIQSNVKYIKFVVLTEEKIRTLDAAFYGGIYPPEQVKNNYNAASANESAQMLFDITEETYGCARIMLPSTYSVYGAPVPLILYAHGSGMMTEWNQEMARYAFHKFFCDEGFAVLEIFGQDNEDWVTYRQGPAGVDPYALQYWIKMYEKAVKKACHIYNLDWDNIHMVCKSQGGHLAYHYVSCPPTFPIRSVSMFAPVLDYLSMRGGRDSAADSRRMLAREAGFEGDIETEFIGKNTYGETCSAFLLANIEKVNGLNEAWRGLVGQTLAEKFAASMDNGEKWWSNTGRTDIYTDTDLCKIGFIPTKIWAATNDTATPYQKSVEAVAQLNNGGTEAHMRTFTTGGHAINTSDGPQTTNVTAANGTVWSTIPTCIYEAAQWMKSKMPHGSI